MITSERIKEYLVIAAVLSSVLVVIDNFKQKEPPPVVPQVAKIEVAPIQPSIKKKKPKNTELDCLAAGIYHEARGEPRDGQLAVGQVIVNRTKSDEFPDSICKVVFQPHQFTGMHHIKYNHETMMVARRLLKKGANWFTDATHFHTIDTDPSWASSPNMMPRGQIGNHLFYKMG